MSRPAGKGNRPRPKLLGRTSPRLMLKGPNERTLQAVMADEAGTYQVPRRLLSRARAAGKLMKGI